MIIVVSGTKYRECVESSHNMGCNKKKGSFGKGVSNHAGDPRVVERTGRIGEVAYGDYMSKEVDWEYRKYGDDRDFWLGKFSVDVKTTIFNGRKKIKACIKCDGKPLNCDVYVACEVASEDRANDIAKVKIHGWLDKKDIEQLPNRKGVGDWYNKELVFNKLKDIEHLLEIQQILEDK